MMEGGLEWSRDRQVHLTRVALQMAGLPLDFKQGALKALKVRMWSECQSPRDCERFRALFDAEVARLAAQPKQRTLEEQVSELTRRLDLLEARR